MIESTSAIPTQITSYFIQHPGQRLLCFFQFRHQLLHLFPEGGVLDLTPAEYARIMEWAAEQAEIDLVDVEGLQEDRDPALLIARLFQAGKATIASAHFFHRTPPTEEMFGILARLDALGSDIVKMAVMPEKQSDVTALMRVTSEVSRESRCPLITMAMGELGTVTRTAGRLFGSSVTFGAAAAASAPGQLPVRELRAQLRMI